MTFKETFELMKQGKKMKLPSWGGYWRWDADKKTIMMHCKDGKILDIRETENVEYTLRNLLSDDWIEATEKNCTLLGGIPTFSFGKACEYIKRGIPVKRVGHEQIFVSAPDKPMVATFTVIDMKANDWTFADQEKKHD